ncbi:MAG: hypothetical protein ABIA47_03395 [bacterium]
MSNRLKQLGKLVVDAVFPRYCVNCGKEGSLMCSVCAVDWSSAPPNAVCIACNGPSQFGKTCCVEGIGIPDGHIASFHYADPVVKGLIRAWKFHFDVTAWRALRGQLAPRLSVIRDLVATYEIDAVVPLPLHSRRLCERGFDQAADLADFIAGEVDVPVCRLLVRNWSTESQADKKSDQDRFSAMQESPFKIAQSPSDGRNSRSLGDESPRRALLIDDVWTTGATAAAATRTLREGGVELVWVYTIAKGR